ncbi:MAG TPA: type II secretion system F family protein [Candidatus Dormibacteraeota bacterium]|jgi:Flp pilus assembly protein TadB|nr:type II secretion system F family protein [Candidatus Dormibacteraeota bacterium]
MIGGIALGVIVVGVAYLVLTGLLPILSANRLNPYAAHTGGGTAVAESEAAYVSPTERLARILPEGLRERYRKPVDIGFEFRWGTFLDRQLGLAIVGVGIALLVFHNPVIAVLAFLLAPGIDYILALRRAKAFQERFLLQLPNALLLVSSAMAAGRNFANALQATTPNLADPIKSELDALANRIQALRVTEPQAFEMWAERLPYPELHTISSALAIGNQVGLETYSLLRSLSNSIQDEIKARNELEALTSQVKSTATIISYLPIAFVLFIYFITPHFVEPLFSTPVGWVTIAIGLGMNYMARWWTGRILRRIEA